MATNFDATVKRHLDTCPGNSDDRSSDGYTERTRFLVLCLAGEAGEAANIVKKQWRGDGDVLDDPQSWEAKLVGEVVDGANYVSMLAAHLSIPILDYQEEKFLEVERRPNWKVWINERSAQRAIDRSAARTATSYPELQHRDDITIELEAPKRSISVPLHPLGTVINRVNDAVDAIISRDWAGLVPPRVVGYRTSVESRQQLELIAGIVETNTAGHKEFLAKRIRVWGEMT